MIYHPWCRCGMQHICSMFNILATTLATNNCRSPFPGTQTTALQWADTTRAGKANDGHRKKKLKASYRFKEQMIGLKKVAIGKYNIFVRQRQHWHEKVLVQDRNPIQSIGNVFEVWALSSQGNLTFPKYNQISPKYNQIQPKYLKNTLNTTKIKLE